MVDIHRIFAQWPSVIPRKGSVVTTFGETVPFVDYLMNGELVLLIRSQPDAQGTRRTIVSTKEIVSIKFQDAIDPERFTAMGFQKPEKAATVGVR